MKKRNVMRWVILGTISCLCVSGARTTVSAVEPELKETILDNETREDKIIIEEMTDDENMSESESTQTVLDDENIDENEQSLNIVQTIQEEAEVKELIKAKVMVDKKVYEEGIARIKIEGLGNETEGIKDVMVAVWSQENQSDLYWYTAQYKENAWYVDMDISTYHNDNWATYTVHTYVTDDKGTKKYVGGTHVDFSYRTQEFSTNWDVEKRKVIINIDKEELKTPGKLKSVQCALWSVEKGQDDLKWYDFYNDGMKWSVEMPFQQLKSHGNCKIHIYLVKENGTKVFAGGATYNLDKPSVKSVDIETVNKVGNFQVVLQGVNIPLGSKQVKVAVWSKDDQSDLLWYEAKKNEEGRYSFASNISKHQYNIGKYNVHTYITDELGISACVSCTTMEFTKQMGELVVSSAEDECYYNIELPIMEYPMGIEAVELGLWSNAKGQDDLKWYKATAKETEQGYLYQFHVDIRNHKTSGTYIGHVYGTKKNGEKVFLTGNGKIINVVGTANGTIKVTDAYENRGIFDVEIFDMKASSGISQVKLAAWTQSDQSDLHWYTCVKQNDGSWKASINIANHKYNSGKYIMHTYSTLNNDIQTFTTGSVYNFEPQNYTYIENNLGKGKRLISILNPTNVNDLRVAVWSNANGQDDLKWYKAEKASNGIWQVVVQANNHKDSGTYYAHVYCKDGMLAGNSFVFTVDECTEKYVWPCPSSKIITSYFGYRSRPTAGASTYHQGIDIGATSGSAIIATKSGKVTACSYNSIRGYYVEITHNDGVKSIYMHMSRQATTTGMNVSRGQIIGYVGSSGVATGPHLHFSIVVNGQNVNPLNYVIP